MRRLYYSGYTLLEYISFAFIFWTIINHKGFKRIILIFSALFISFQIIYYSTVKFRRLDSVPVGIETIIVFIYIIYYLFEQFKSTKVQSLYENYLFWVCIAIMFYLAGSFFFYILANHLDKAQISEFWYLSFNADIIKNILFAVAVIIYARKNYELKKVPSVPYLDMI